MAQPAKNLTATQKLREHLDSRLQAMEADRWSWFTHWRELAEFILPRRYLWLISANRGYRGSPLNQHIVDETGTVAARVLSAGMMSGITSPARPWFRLTVPNMDVADTSPVKLWLDECQKRMARVMGESNYYTAKATQYSDLAVFGTAPMLIYEDFQDVIRCFNPAAGEYYVASSSRFAVDTFYRKFTLTVAQVVEQFGVENCSATVQALYRDGGAGLTREIIVAHAVEPNVGDYARGTVPSRFPFREVYWEWGQAKADVLATRGFHEQPFSCPRWDILGNDSYGRSPGMDALPGIKQLQLEQKRKAQAIDKMVNPPMIADVQLKNEPASLLPGGITYVANVNGVGFKPAYEVEPNINEMREDITEVQNRIKSVFFNDLFLMISQLDTVRTATEIDARREEKLIQLGPVLERFENESLDCEIDRIFAIMSRAGLLPPAPKELQGAHLQIQYDSMLAQAQRAASTTAIERLAAFTGNLAGADPGALDNLDLDEMVDEYADALGVSPRVIRSSVQVAQIRQQRTNQVQQQQAMQASMAAVQGAQTLSQTDVGGGQNALQMMLGNAPSQPQQAAA